MPDLSTIWDACIAYRNTHGDVPTAIQMHEETARSLEKAVLLIDGGKLVPPRISRDPDDGILRIFGVEVIEVSNMEREAVVILPGKRIVAP